MRKVFKILVLLLLISPTPYTASADLFSDENKDKFSDVWEDVKEEGRNTKELLKDAAHETKEGMSKAYDSTKEGFSNLKNKLFSKDED